MKIITQISMFDDTQNENLGDLERLQVTVQTIVKIDEILKNRFVDKLRQDAKSG